MHEHLSKQFDSELDEVRTYLTRMGGLVEEQLRTALTAFEEGDQELIETVIARDESVDAMEIAIDEACIKIIARRQPTAIDLRMIMSAGKTVTDLERIGDEAKKIAKTTLKILERGMSEPISQSVGINTVGDLATNMLHDVLDSFVRLDTEKAMHIARQDKEVDKHFRAIVRQQVTYMMEDPRTITTALDIIFIAKSIERIGDHCKNIAEDVIYIAKGRDVRHISLDELERTAREE